MICNVRDQIKKKMKMVDHIGKKNKDEGQKCSFIEMTMDIHWIETYPPIPVLV